MKLQISCLAKRESFFFLFFFFFLSLQNSTMAGDRPRTHWVPTLNVHSLAEDWRFDRYSIPMELYKSIQ